MAKRDRQFWESASLNNATFRQYYNRLTELSISMFKWKNLPDTVDPRYLELTLFTDGQAVFFKDEEIGFLALQNAKGGKFNVYRIPVNRRAYAVNGYQKDLTDKDSVIIFNNYLHSNSRLDVEMFSRRLWNLDRAIDVNANAQKTPVLIQCDETQRLTMLNLYKKYDGNEPFIFGDKNLNPNAIKTLKTDAPYVADKLYQLKTQIWNEALTYLGISNINITKKERLITDEVTRNQGGTIASRYSRLEARRDACREINKMFGLDIWCDYREDYQALSEEVLTDGDDVTEEGGEPNE
nr:MAG TPA: upper collar protein [Caudoviricetes sp.]